VLLPDLAVDVLAQRNAGRPEEQRVPLDVLEKHAHRRSLLSADVLRDEGFDAVHEAGDRLGIRDFPRAPQWALLSRSPAAPG